MSVRAMFQVNEIRFTPHWNKNDDGSQSNLVTIKMSPVQDGSEEANRFWAATPSGSLELGTVNEAAAEQFALGQTFYVDFTPTEE